MWCEAVLITVGAVIVLWLVHCMIEWVLDDGIFFDGGYWPEDDGETEEDDSRSD